MQKTTVTELVKEIKGLLEGNFSQVFLDGEISNLSRSASGHWYFSLSDGQSTISSVLFRGDAMRNPEIRRLKDGDQVSVVGQIGVYAPRGSFQIICKRLAKKGKGDLKTEFEKLKAQLAQEGLFDLEKKKPLPALPKRVAVITSATGAAVHDFLKTLENLTFGGSIVVVPCLVQGFSADQSIIKAIEKCERSEQEFDLIVLTRGGGSLEDLWCFNSELLSRKISSCSIPFVSAIGHQTDYTLADYVADIRCATPTAAAVEISKNYVAIDDRLSNQKSKLIGQLRAIRSEIQTWRRRANPANLANLLLLNVENKKRQLEGLNIINRKDQLLNIFSYHMKLDESLRIFNRSIESKQKLIEQRLEIANAKLKVLSPLNSLARGYTYIQTEEKKVLSSVSSYDQVSVDKNIQIVFKDGVRNARKI